MTAATAGIWNPAPQSAATPFASTRAMDDSGDSGDSNGATISANDFLTLLVTEMQNQDPTADTDPNEYINQLVNVNSLEQLIDINQTLSGAAGTASQSQPSSTPAAATQQIALHGKAHATAASSATGAAAAAKAALSGPATGSPVQSKAASSGGATASHPAITHGNLSAPATSRSALGVAHALDAPRITR